MPEKSTAHSIDEIVGSLFEPLATDPYQPDFSEPVPSQSESLPTYAETAVVAALVLDGLLADGLISLPVHQYLVQSISSKVALFFWLDNLR